MSLVLASKSEARASVLSAAGVSFEMQGSGVDEGPLKSAWAAQGWSAAQIAGGLAEAKALAVAPNTSALVVGADQTLELEGRLFDKPAYIDEARERLLALRGRTHRLHSAVVLARGDVVLWRDTPSADLRVRPFSDAWLDDYLERMGDTVLESVGAYQVEGLGLQLFEAIEGDWTTILGLPMLGLMEQLRLHGELTR